jgi:hypothetical protein
MTQSCAAGLARPKICAQPQPTPPRASGLFSSFASVHRRVPTLVGLGLVLSVMVLASGCVSKATAQAQARAAFLEGQRQGLEQAQARQGSGSVVTVVGQVKNSVVPWAPDLTLAKAVVAAQYYGHKDPRQIVIVRGGKPIPVGPQELLSGQDVPLQAGDVVQLIQ